jgi:hypothetical protein
MLLDKTKSSLSYMRSKKSPWNDQMVFECISPCSIGNFSYLAVCCRPTALLCPTQLFALRGTNAVTTKKRQTSLLAYCLQFEKQKSSSMRSSRCVCPRVSPFNNFWKHVSIIMKRGMYVTSLRQLNAVRVFHTQIPPIINSNITWMPERNDVKPGIYITPPEATSPTKLINSSLRKISTVSSQPLR